jgi:RNA recognition motif-containing protein
MNIYIGNLNYRVKEENLKHVLEEYGTVDSVKVIKDRDTGRSKGYAFAEMSDDDDARAAIEGLNGAEMQGRALVIKEALPKK